MTDPTTQPENGCILVLEDDPDLGLLIERSLEAQGYYVSLHRNSTSALDFYENAQVHCVVADIFVVEDGIYSQDGGIRLISTLKQLKGDSVPIVAISGAFAREDRLQIGETAKTVGADVLLSKPFRPQELIDVVDRLLSRKAV